MKLSAFIALFFVSSSVSFAQSKQEKYPVHPDSVRQDGVPQGKVEGPFDFNDSKIYPGTIRKYWVYVPDQYDKAKPACLMVVQDGFGRARGWKLPTVMDNLIHRKEMPVTIGIFIDHGKVMPMEGNGKNAQPRFNRSFEYDSMGDRYARFLIEEILPAVGAKWNLSDDPNDRSIAGASSGAICAWTVAWERPNHFRRVISTIGTYVGLRGGNEYPVLVRKTENKPIRAFLQDGSSDLDIYAGSWWVANQDMLASLNFAGYDVRHVWGQGGHNGKHSTAIMPDALKWIWRDYPEPIKPGTPPTRRQEFLIDGEDWQLISKGHKYTEGPSVNAKGEVFFSDSPNSRIHKIALDGTVSVFAENCGRNSGMMFGADGYLYVCQRGAKKIVRYDESGNEETLFEDAPCNDCVSLGSTGYYSDPDNQKIWFVDAEGQRRVVAEDVVTFPNGLHVTTDHQFLLVADSRSRWITSFQIQADGSLAHGQKYGYLHVLQDDTQDSAADGMTVDDKGFTYVATRIGLQVLDQLGRVHLIIRKPQEKKLSNVCFGGENLDTIFATCGDKVYKRKLKRKGVVPWKGAVKPPKPGL